MDSTGKGLMIVFISLALFFLFPLDSFLGISQTALASLKQIGIQNSFTFYSLFRVCSEPTVSIVFSQCGFVMFGSIVIFIAIFLGMILVVKSMIKSGKPEIRTQKTKPKAEKKEVKPKNLGRIVGISIVLIFLYFFVSPLLKNVNCSAVINSRDCSFFMFMFTLLLNIVLIIGILGILYVIVQKITSL